MSGGAFNYNQHKIREIWEDIQQKLDEQGKPKLKSDLRYFDKEDLEQNPELKFKEFYSKEVQQIFKKGVMALKISEIYTQRIDWYLSGDDGEDSLISRLKEDLEKLI